ncbi:Sec-independent protein translocase protein TatB [Motilimonas sp. KMU-193]|uniref:Sec-independent protein translocase protein TatB n=1 Tax=Motilimonas sp. KMU-193 TaxID=3388668 RepID=UPI00396AF1F5
MFDIGFWEIVLISVIGLVVLGPERLPVAIRTVMGWVRTVKGTANAMKDELSQELKIHEMHENLRKAEQQGLEGLSPELHQSVESLKQAAQSVTRPYGETSNEANTASPVESSKVATPASAEPPTSTPSSEESATSSVASQEKK